MFVGLVLVVLRFCGLGFDVIRLFELRFGCLGLFGVVCLVCAVRLGVVWFGWFDFDGCD